MQKFRFNGALATAEVLAKSGLCEAVFSGPMTPKAFNSLRLEALQASTTCTSYVIRMDKALVLLGDDPPVDSESYSTDTAAGAMIVRAEEYDFWITYSKKAANFGIVRTIWTETNARLAYQWALRRSCLRTAELQR